MEPVEEVMTEVDDEFTGQVIEELTARKGELLEMVPATAGRTKITWHLPSRGLIGYRSQFYSNTRGTGILTSRFDSYMQHMGEVTCSNFRIALMVLSVTLLRC